MYFYLRHRSRRLGYDDWIRGWKKSTGDAGGGLSARCRGGTPLHEPDDARLLSSSSTTPSGCGRKEAVRKFAVAKAANEAIVDQFRPRGDY
jgi:hypothetical protein